MLTLPKVEWCDKSDGAPLPKIRIVPGRRYFDWCGRVVEVDSILGEEVRYHSVTGGLRCRCYIGFAQTSWHAMEDEDNGRAPSGMPLVLGALALVVVVTLAVMAVWW